MYICQLTQMRDYKILVQSIASVHSIHGTKGSTIPKCVHTYVGATYVDNIRNIGVKATES